MIKRAILIILFISCCAAGRAENYKKIPLAIMEFRANNADACADILMEKLYSTKMFTLMEKGQMDKIAREHGFTGFSSTDPDQVVRLGKILSVEKLLVGSITHLGPYIIDIKLLNVTTGEIEFNVKRKIASTDKLEPALDEMAKTIERYCMGYYRLSGNFDIKAMGLLLAPIGTLAGQVKPGAGVQADIMFNSPFKLPLDFELSAGYCRFTPKINTIKSFDILPVYVSAACKFVLARNLRLVPSAGFGYVFSIISSNDNENGPGDTPAFRRHFYYNPCIVIKPGLDIFLFDRWYLVFSPQYTIFFTGGRTGQFVSLGLGVKMLF